MTEIPKQRVFSERVRLLFRGPVRSVSMNYIAILMLAILLYGKISTFNLIFLLILALVVTTVRLIIVFKDSPYTRLYSDPRRKLNSFVIGVGIQGLVWGGILAYFQYQLPTVYEAIILMLVTIAIAVTVVTFSTSKSAFFIFLIATVSPQIIVLLVQGEELHIIMSLYMIAGCTIITNAFLWNYRRLERSIELRFEKDNLMDDLNHTKEHLERSNENLKRLQYQLKSESLTDELTGIANRRHFNNHLEKEWRRAQRNQTSIACCMIDIDFFKKYNDLYGHQQGDECLISIAQKIRSFMRRPADMTARYGGEEFVVLLPGAPLEAATELANNICKSVESLKILNEGSPQKIVTISIGLAIYIPQRDSGPDVLLKLADKALYEAKGQGRNRVVVN